MKFAKSMALMMIGAGAVLAYQKYEKPMIRGAKKTMRSALEKSDQMLDDMD